MSRNEASGASPPKKRIKRDNSESTLTKLKNEDQDGKKSEEVKGQTSNSKTFLKDQNIYILQAGIGKARTDLFKKQITNNGGTYNEKLSPDTTYIVVDEKMDVDRMCRILKLNAPPNEVTIVKSLWLSTCLKQKQLATASDYKLDTSTLKIQEDIGANEEEKDKVSKSNSDKSEIKSEQKEIKFRFYKHHKKAVDETSDVDSDYEQSGGEQDVHDELDDLTAAVAPRRPLPTGSWACAQASGQQKVNHNKAITDKLEALATIYENTNDRWRALGYQKGIAALKRHPKKITTFEEAKSLQGVGERLANKIWEIIESGELRKLDEISSSEEVQAINIFTKIWGAGAATARQWVSLGYRTLDDIRTKAKLTRHQKIGLEYYDDLNERMQREEAGRIADTVEAAARRLDPGLVCMPCGSYRRGKETCGDVDVLITHPDGRSHHGVFEPLLADLHKTGFLTDDLVTNEDNGAQKKYMGVCRLPAEGSKHRRLDIIVVPYDEFACAVMYFTGSAHFNRSMRHLAGKMGMSLSEHSLNVGVVRSKGEKLTKGTPLPTPTEESVFKHLGLTYRPPDQRNH